MCVYMDNVSLKSFCHNLWAMEGNGQVDNEAKWTRKIFICFYEDFEGRGKDILKRIKFDNYYFQ